MFSKYANIVFNLPVDETFTYSIPIDLQDENKIGVRVLVPFGKRNVTGIVINFCETTDLKTTRPIIKILDAEPVINKEMIDFCTWISEYYYCTVGQVIFSSIPKSTLIESKVYYSVNENYLKNEKVNQTQEKIIKLLRNKTLTIKQIENKLKISNVRASINKLINLNVIETEQVTSQEKVKPKKEKYVTFELLDEFEGYTKAMMENFAKESKVKSAKQIEVLNYLAKHKIKIIRFNDLLKKISSGSSSLNTLAKKELIGIEYKEIIRRPETEFGDDDEITQLNEEQKSVLSELSSAASNNEFKPFLLFGVTGSGKTQIYIEIIREIIAQNKTAIVLVPEIALTPQLIHRFQTNFADDTTGRSDKIGVIHSRISEGERFDVFRRIISGEIKVVIGARSAIFAPLKNIGIIIVDEEHDHSYKQTEKDPKYNARDAAIVRAKINNAIAILGSATPSLESFFNAKLGKYNLLELPHRALKTKQPNIEIINMREELRSASKYQKNETLESKFLSSELLSQIGNALHRRQSIILLQNRRGYSAYLECQDCGYVKKCRNCDITLIYHKFREHLRCHYCGYSERLTEICGFCGSKNIQLKGTGTEKVEEEIQRIFPAAKIKRMDADTVQRKDAYRRILKSFHEKEFDILIGTQMISKGLDFPNVFLVGVISADVGLLNPDFRAPERTFQLLMQVAGRSGRSSDFGRVIIQTMHPENYLFPIVQNHDYISFYEKEIASRSNFNYPPFSRMTLIEVKDKNPEKANSIASRIYIYLNNNKSSNLIEILKPAPAILYKLKNYYRFHVIIKMVKYKTDYEKNLSMMTSKLINGLKEHLSDFKIPVQNHISIEADPLSFY